MNRRSTACKTCRSPFGAASSDAIAQIKPWRGANKADAVARAGGLSQSLETGRCRTVEGSLAVFEEQACDWQMGQHQPDRDE